jgi:hypothetical protein
MERAASHTAKYVHNAGRSHPTCMAMFKKVVAKVDAS